MRKNCLRFTLGDEFCVDVENEGRTKKKMEDERSHCPQESILHTQTKILHILPHISPHKNKIGRRMETIQIANNILKILLRRHAHPLFP
jgi:hypothetical protein